jgi:plastocyanin
VRCPAPFARRLGTASAAGAAFVCAGAFALAAAPTGAVEGTVTGAPATSLILVYVEDVSKPTARREAMKAVIRQKDSAFVPDAVAVVAGGSVTFPNEDFISHNVFSLSSGSKFDLGIYPTGDSRSVKFTVPGEVDVFCNIHPAMIAKILVLPNDLFVAVKPNRPFRLMGIPPGQHTVVAWSSTHESVRTVVEVKAGRVAKLAFALRPRGVPPPHLNKDLQPYDAAP